MLGFRDDSYSVKLQKVRSMCDSVLIYQVYNNSVVFFLLESPCRLI